MSEAPARMKVSEKAKQIAKLLRSERPDYFYLKDLFRHLRQELKVTVETQFKKLPYVPSEEEIKKYYEAVWHGQYANGGKLRARTELEQQIYTECGRLLANCAILYNARFLSQLLETKEKEGGTKAVDAIKKISPVAWQHFNFYGQFEFKKLVQLIPIEELMSFIKWRDFDS